MPTRGLHIWAHLSRPFSNANRRAARQGAIERLDGQRQPKGLTTIESPSFEQAKRWHDSDE